MTYDEMVAKVRVYAELEHERRVLARLERIRRCAWQEGALGTPGLDRNIAETRDVIAQLEARR